MSILGAHAFFKKSPVERYLRDAKAFEIVEGTTNIQKTIIAQIALGDTINRW